jgi:hypothetical protein
MPGAVRAVEVFELDLGADVNRDVNAGRRRIIDHDLILGWPSDRDPTLRFEREGLHTSGSDDHQRSPGIDWAQRLLERTAGAPSSRPRMYPEGEPLARPTRMTPVAPPAAGAG